MITYTELAVKLSEAIARRATSRLPIDSAIGSSPRSALPCRTDPQVPAFTRGKFETPGAGADAVLRCDAWPDRF